ncbi:MAG: hypothetical protein ACI861_001443 [Paracoccaceae bacterium]|jgi:hypothetical protein
MTVSVNRRFSNLTAALVLVSFVGACGAARESRLNPFNWFGKDRNEQVVVDEDAQIVDPRPLVAEIIKLRVDRLPGGAIVHAIGLPATQGHWEAALVPVNSELPDKGVLTYEFRLIPPLGAKTAGTKVSREVVVAHFISDQTMLGVRRIQVIAQQNRRTVKR